MGTRISGKADMVVVKKEKEEEKKKTTTKKPGVEARNHQTSYVTNIKIKTCDELRSCAPTKKTTVLHLAGRRILRHSQSRYQWRRAEYGTGR